MLRAARDVVDLVFIGDSVTSAATSSKRNTKLFIIDLANNSHLPNSPSKSDMSNSSDV